MVAANYNNEVDSSENSSPPRPYTRKAARLIEANKRVAASLEHVLDARPLAAQYRRMIYPSRMGRIHFAETIRYPRPSNVLKASDIDNPRCEMLIAQRFSTSASRTSPLFAI